jgi:hypothetical protein
LSAFEKLHIRGRFAQAGCEPKAPAPAARANASKWYATTADNDNGTAELISKCESREDASIAEEQILAAAGL